MLVLLGLGAFADIGDLKLFKHDGLMLSYQFFRLLVMEVPALIGNLTMRLGDLRDRLPTAMRPALLSGEDSLQLPQLLLSAAKVAGWLDEGPIR